MYEIIKKQNKITLHKIQYIIALRINYLLIYARKLSNITESIYCEWVSTIYSLRDYHKSNL